MMKPPKPGHVITSCFSQPLDVALIVACVNSAQLKVYVGRRCIPPCTDPLCCFILERTTFVHNVNFGFILYDFNLLNNLLVKNPNISIMCRLQLLHAPVPD